MADPAGAKGRPGWRAVGVLGDYRRLAWPTCGPGDYVVRVCARDRGSEWDLGVDVARERFHFDIWGAEPSTPPMTVQASSGYGRFRDG